MLNDCFDLDVIRKLLLFSREIISQLFRSFDFLTMNPSTTIDRSYQRKYFEYDQQFHSTKQSQLRSRINSIQSTDLIMRWFIIEFIEIQFRHSKIHVLCNMTRAYDCSRLLMTNSENGFLKSIENISESFRHIRNLIN